MISLTIITKSYSQSNEIIQLLLKERLVIEGTIQNKTNWFRLDENENVIEGDSSVLICTTKGLLFNKIDMLLREQYKNEMPTLYSTPIVNMDWDQSKILIEETQTV